MIANNILFVHRFLTSLVFTGIIETIVLIILLLFVFRNRTIEISRMMFAGAYASFSTIPYVWFVFPFLMRWSPSTAIIFAETFVFVIEAIFYRWFLRLDWRIAFALSFICNVVSYFLGPLLRMYGIWVYW
jgi:hypothetical protein